MLRRCKTVLAATFGLMVLLLCVPAHAQQTAKRLILKDGSYQAATKWEVKGDRVRYFSAERFEWEELPKDLVDWPATEKWEKQKASTSEEVKEVTAELDEEKKEEEARSPTVAPGLKLPSNGGIFLLDDFHGQKQLAEVVQNGSEINKQTGRNILRAAINPLAVAKQSIELKGLHARVQAHETQPVIYANVELGADDIGTSGNVSTEPTPEASQRFRIVRLDRKKDSRVVGNLKIAITGKTSQQQSFVQTNVATMPGGWMKITPALPLQPGEYALVEMLSPKEMNLYVWDFGVDPNAPANSTAWKPQPVQNTETGTTQSPVLHPKRP
jgi:hypothetical protein